MNFLISNIQYIHVIAMTILLSMMAMSIRRLRIKEMRWLVLMLLCLASFVAKIMHGSSASIVDMILNDIFYFTPVVFMLGIQSNFDDEFELGRLEWGIISFLLIYFFVLLAGKILGYELSGLALLVSHNLMFSLVAFCVFWAYWRTIQTWSNDLVESRRKLRMFFVILLGPVICVGAAFCYFAYYGEPWAQYTNLYVCSAIILGGMYSFFAFGDFSEAQLSVEALEPQDKEKTERGVGSAERGVENAEQGYQREIDILRTIMEVEKRYLESNLNMVRLAEYAKIPEYKLRVAINQVLGHKNFNAYLNTYRIDAAKAMLSDSNNDGAITNIAIDCGYLNQSTFNKAFRKAMHLTPSEFRELEKKQSS